MTSGKPVASGWHVGVATVCIALLAWVIARAWIADDAAITVRSVDNLLHGYGWRWNVSERVQSFTHPLWAMMIVPIMALGVPWYATVLLLDICVTGAAIGVLALASSSAPAAVVSLLGLGWSQAFADFSSSGLENPLANLLLVCLVAAVPTGVESVRDVRRVSLLAALLALARLDLMVIALPVVVYVSARTLSRGGGRPASVLAALALGMVPLLAWELFSIVYFGFPFPNTAYAKLNTGIDRLAYLRLGWNYFRYTLSEDPWTLVGPAIFLTLAVRWRASAAVFAIALGSALYLAYVSWIGGDFMGGRFFVAPLVTSAALLSSRHVRAVRGKAPWLILAICGLGALGVARPLHLLLPGENQGVVDERSHNPSTALSSLWRAGRGGPDNTWLRLGAAWRKEASRARESDPRGTLIKHGYAVGMLGLAAGPGVHLVDHLALTDPFLARLPAAYDPKVQIGHFERMGQWSAPVSVTTSCPLEYEVCRFWSEYQITLATERCALADPKLCEYWDAVRSVTRGALFSRERWMNILRLNSGGLNFLIDRDHYRSASRVYPASNG